VPLEGAGAGLVVCGEELAEMLVGWRGRGWRDDFYSCRMSLWRCDGTQFSRYALRASLRPSAEWGTRV
jgi:hypothetical protein